VAFNLQEVYRANTKQIKNYLFVCAILSQVEVISVVREGGR